MARVRLQNHGEKINKISLVPGFKNFQFNSKIDTFLNHNFLSCHLRE
jgi:hypothetical protein